MTKKHTIALTGLITASSLCLLACSNQENATSTIQTQTDYQSSTPIDQQSNIEEIVDITVKFINPGGNVKEGQRIADAINKISESSIGVHANIDWIDFGEWNTQMNLAFASNENIDIISVSPAMNLNSMVQSNQLTDISELLDTYGTGAKSAVEKLLPSVTYGDAIYGLPKLIDMRGSYGITMNKDILNELGLLEFAENMKTWDEYEELLTKVHEAYPDITPLFVSAESLASPSNPTFNLASNNFSENFALSLLGDPYNLIYVDKETNEVKCVYDSDFYETMADRVSRWYAKGLIYKDGAVTTEDNNALLNSGVIFSYCAAGDGTPEIRNATTQALVPDHEVCYIPICDTEPSATSVTMFGYAVPYTSTEPEAAVKFLNLMYTNADIQNLLQWGEEGIDYIVKDGVATYPDGIDSNSVGYHSQEFNYGNSYLAYPWQGKPASYNEDNQAYYDAMEEIKYLGCSVDTTSVTTQATACYNTFLSYSPTLIVGLSESPKQELNSMMEQLTANGINDYIDCYQTQLNDWLSSNQ